MRQKASAVTVDDSIHVAVAAAVTEARTVGDANPTVAAD
jgi:hypothetical protein